MDMDKSARLAIMLIASSCLVVFCIFYALGVYDDKPAKKAIVKECTEIPPTFFEQDGWRRVHEADYFYVLNLRSKGKAETMTHPMKCRQFAGPKPADFTVVWEEQLWWRKI